jgi:hypothetical protein
MVRFFDSMNTPIAVLAVLVVVVGVNAFLYFGQRSSEAPATEPAERGGPQPSVTASASATSSP